MTQPDTMGRVLQYLRKALVNQQNDGPEVIVPTMPDTVSIPSGHFHTTPEIFIQTGGYTDFVLPWTQFRLGSSRMCVIPAYTPHHERFVNFKSRFNFIVGAFGFDGLFWHEASLDDHGQLRQTPSVFCRVLRMPRLIGFWEQTACPEFRSSKYGKIQRKAARLLALSAMLDAMENADMLPRTEHPKVSWCKRLIHDHLDKDFLCVKYLAGITECSPNYLSSLFHKETRTRLNDYINTRRLERVQGLLKHSTFSIEQIATASGYDDPGYMTRVFVKKNGLTPRAYRGRIEQP